MDKNEIILKWYISARSIVYKAIHKLTVIVAKFVTYCIFVTLFSNKKTGQENHTINK